MAKKQIPLAYFLEGACFVAFVLLSVLGAISFSIGLKLGSLTPLFRNSQSTYASTVLTFATVAGALAFIVAGISIGQGLWKRSRTFFAVSIVSLSVAMIVDLAAAALVFILRDSASFLARNEDHASHFRQLCKGFVSCQAAVEHKIKTEGGMLGLLLMGCTLLQILLVAALCYLCFRCGIFVLPTEDDEVFTYSYTTNNYNENITKQHSTPFGMFLSNAGKTFSMKKPTLLNRLKRIGTRHYNSGSVNEMLSDNSDSNTSMKEPLNTQIIVIPADEDERETEELNQPINSNSPSVDSLSAENHNTTEESRSPSPNTLLDITQLQFTPDLHPPIRVATD